MQNRRFTRLTNAFSKKLENHAYMLAIIERGGSGLSARRRCQFVKSKRTHRGRSSGIGTAVKRHLGYAILGIHFDDDTAAPAVGEHHKIFDANFVHGSACYNSGAKLDHYQNDQTFAYLRLTFALLPPTLGGRCDI
jgi:hypothetical protein